MAVETGLGTAAREALSSACDRVEEPGELDRVDGVRPGLVTRPATTEQVAEVLRAAAGHGLTAVPRGSGTKMTWGRAPTSADVLVDVSAMDRVLDHAAGDLIVDVEAGARLSEVQESLAGAGQRLGLDETVPGASVGGTLATNASGAQRLLTGTARDLLIGVTLVRADGVVAKAGGRVVKNVAGYDLGKLLIGSFGTLAVVTRAVFRLHPVPAARAWVSAPVGDATEAHRLVQVLVHSQAVPSAIEIDWPASGPRVVSVLLEGRPGGVEGRVASTRAALGAGAEVADPASVVATYPWTTGLRGDDRATALKLTFVISGLAEVLTAVGEAAAPVSLRGSVGTGVVYAEIPSGTDPAAVVSTVSGLRAACARNAGALVVVDAPAAVKRSVDVWGPVGALDLMRQVKHRFDPDHRLAPGRFVGGI